MQPGRSTTTSASQSPTPPAPEPRPTGVRGLVSRLPLVQRPDIPPELTELARAIREHSPSVDLREVLRVYRYARDAHSGQFRRSGDPYITHPVAVATELARLGFDTDTLNAALLHDVVEDTPATRDQISEYFGSPVAHLVDGVTKLDRVKVDSKQHQQAETFRKMILAMSQDIRVLVIKLADRLHNMSTLEHMPRDKQKRIAQETLDIYAPLAHRLGMQRFKLQLEDLGFKALHPKRYDEIVAMVQERTPERDAWIEDVSNQVNQLLRGLRIRGEVHGRPKHYYSIYEKMTVRGHEFNEIHDLVGMRIIVGTVGDCYAVLGQIHTQWRPIENRFKDYIANPKFNLYQSLHTSVIGPEGAPLEVQIRTRAMHQTAEYGVAAHWKYKDNQREGTEDAAFPWLDNLLEWQGEVSEPSQYLSALKHDLYQDEVFVFTPRGDVKALPRGATPIDFAYAVHTEVGHRCVGAKVNQRLVPLSQELGNGDVVEILTSKSEDAGPSRDWLDMVASTRAESKIRNYFNRERREDAQERGRDAVTRALRRRGVGWARARSEGALDHAAEALSYKTVDALLRAVGERHVPAGAVVGQAMRIWEDDEPEPDSAPTQRPLQIDPTTTDRVSVDGDTGMMVQLAQCCMPVPGDNIFGYVTKSRGVSVHQMTCTNASDLLAREEDIVEVEWSNDHDADDAFKVVIEVEAFDRKHLLRDVTQVLGDLHLNIIGAQVMTKPDRQAVLLFTFELADLAHLDYALDRVRGVDSVYDARRVTPGRG